MLRLVVGLVAASFVAAFVPARAADDAPESALAKSVLMDALDVELKRSFDALKDREKEPLYFLAYRATEQKSWSASASFGALNGDSSGSSRRIDVEARVGSPELDSTHQIRGSFDFGARLASGSLPLEDDAAAIRAAAWLATDRAYKTAQERMIKVRSNEKVKVEAEDTSADFSAAPAGTYFEAPVDLVVAKDAWKERLRKLSAIFREYAFLHDANVSIEVNAENRVYLNTEGTRLTFGRTHVRVSINGSTKADDGMDLDLYDSFDAPTEADMPDDATIEKAVRQLCERLGKLRAAPIVEPFAGPAILMNRATGVFFHEIFGHRIEGHRQKDVDEGQTFTKKVNQEVMPAFLSVHDDPTRAKFGSIFLNGRFQYDDEGVAAQSVPLVESGILKNFLMSRSPIENFPTSNGHGRCSPGYPPVSRQGNLIVSSTERVEFARLRAMLLEEIARQNKPYGLIFHDISGGYTTTQRSGPQAFKVQPLYVVRVYPDGREDEVVRGVDLVGTPLVTITRILATADDDDVFNGFCGAESGWVPVSAIAPSVLVAEIEIEKKAKSQERPPLLPPPMHDTTSGGN